MVLLLLTHGTTTAYPRVPQRQRQRKQIMLIFYPVCRSLQHSTNAVGLATPPPSRTAVSSSSEPAGFALALHRLPVSAWVGWCPTVKSPSWSGLPFTSLDFHDFRAHGPSMRIDDISASLGRFVARVSASVAIVDCRPGLRVFSPTANLRFRFGFSRTLRGRPGFCRSPRCSDDYRPARSSPDDRFTGRRFRRDH